MAEIRLSESLDVLQQARQIAARKRREGDQNCAQFRACLNEAEFGIPRPQRIFRLDAAIGCTAWARLSVSGATSERPIAPISPAVTSRASSPTVSSIGIDLSTRWT